MPEQTYLSIGSAGVAGGAYLWLSNADWRDRFWTYKNNATRRPTTSRALMITSAIKIGEVPVLLELLEASLAVALKSAAPFALPPVGV